MPDKHQRKPVSDAAVRKATGADWKAWVRTLEHAGAVGWTHAQTARWLERDRGLSGWWAQTVTVGFERLALGRAAHQKGAEFEVSGSKTLPVPVAQLWSAWFVPSERRKWLGDEARFEVRRGTENKSLRVTWVDGATHVDVYFLDKGPGKAQVAVQHRKLATAAAAKREKAAWKRRLGALAELLAPGAAAAAATSSGSASRKQTSRKTAKRTVTKRSTKKASTKTASKRKASKKRVATKRSATKKAAKRTSKKVALRRR